MINCKEELLKVLYSNGKTIADVECVVIDDNGNYVSIGEFLNLAQNVEYDNGYGLPRMYNLSILLNDGTWLERGEYDGSEWWEYKKRPKALALLNRPLEYRDFVDTTSTNEVVILD